MNNSKKTILVTGSGNGLGLDLLKNLSNNKKLILVGIVNRKKNQKKNILNLIYIDLFNMDEIKSISNKFSKHSVDTVIHCAGGGLGFREKDISAQKLDKLMKLNFYSIFELNKILIKNKKKNNRLNIIHIGSIAGFEAKASIGYSASKASLVSYNKNLAYQYFDKKVYSKLLIPGSFVSTNGSMQRLKKNKPKIFKELEKNLRSKKMLTSKDIIPTIKFLMQKESDILTGSIISASNLESLNNFL
jgi:short-subunit dehydrogenase|tara:strand:+ start:3698 stop:4432 length:735 start_codon:yes stop_codon:yes gene_type:complete